MTDQNKSTESTTAKQPAISALGAVLGYQWAHGCEEYYETGWRGYYNSKEAAIEAGRRWHEDDFLVSQFRRDLDDECELVCFGEEFKIPHSISDNSQ